MQVRKRTYVDVHYTKDEQKSVMKLRKKLLNLGYTLQVEDAGSEPYDFCDQYLGHESSKNIEDK